MSAAATAILATGMGIAAGSQILSGFSSYEENKAQARIYKTNADIALKQAENEAAREKDKYRRFAASQRASFGASGLDVNEGSPLDVLADTDAEGAVSAMQLLYGGQLEAANWRQRAQQAYSSGRISRSSGILGGLSSGLTGAAKFWRF